MESRFGGQEEAVGMQVRERTTCGADRVRAIVGALEAEGSLLGLLRALTPAG